MIQLKTKRLQIVPLTIEQMGDYIKQPQADEHMAAALHEMYNGCAAHPKDWLWYTSWQILLRSDGTSIGSLGFKGGPMNGSVEIGYGIDPPYQNQGYATEAVKAITEWAFTQTGVYFVLAETEKDNTASIQVLEKNGFIRVGDGLEGPRWAKEKPASSWMSIFMCLGMCIGISFGTAQGNLAIGLPIGLCLGLAIGSALDAQDKAMHSKYKDEMK